MEKTKEIETIGNAIDLIVGEVSNIKTAVIKDKNNLITWLDIDDNDPKTKMAFELAEMTTTLGFHVLDKWEKMKHHFPKEVRAQVEELLDEMDSYAMMELAKNEE